jgi:O-antigen/teichoic acid export membrane protein
LLLAFVPTYGLTGAAAAAALAVVTEQGLIVATALRRLRVAPGTLAVRVWRPVAAAGVMALVLWAAGLGWSDDAALVPASLAGAAVYVTALLGCWAAAGRPQGAEADALTLIARLWRRR